jgi:AraC-like DNA-binding protein
MDAEHILWSARDMGGGAEREDQKGESIEFRTLMPGVTLLTVSRSRRLWTMFHETYSITTVLGGSGRWTCRGQERDVSAGRLMLIEPGEVHVTKEVGQEASFRSLFIAPDVLKQNVEALELSTETPHFTSIERCHPDTFGAFRALHAALDQSPAEASDRFWNSLGDLFAQATEKRSSPAPEATPRAIVTARDAIAELFERSDLEYRIADIPRIAKQVGLTPRQLFRGFHKYYQLPPYQYFIQHRLAHARRLIAAGPARGSETLEDVALESGYDDLSHMGRDFRRFLGMSPRRYAVQASRGSFWRATRDQDLQKARR